MARVDIRTVTVPRERSVWRLFPGANYKFLPIYEEDSSIFLDLPGARFSQNDSDSAIVAKIAASQHANDLLRQGYIDEAKAVDPADFLLAAHTKYRGKVRQAVRNLFFVAKQFDIVIVPSSLSAGQLFVGWLDTPPGSMSYVFPGRRYADMAMPSRSIKWITKVEENKLSSDLTKILRNQSPFSLLAESLRAEVFSLAYKNFQYESICSSVIFNSKDDFTTSDSAFISFIAQISARATYVTSEESDGRPLFGNSLDFLFDNTPEEFLCDQIVDIHSEGFNRFVSSRLSPIVISAVIAMLPLFANVSSATERDAIADQTEFMNSSVGADPNCTIFVSNASKTLMKAIDVDKLRRICQASEVTHNRAGLYGHAKVHK